jgi:hypothetical protein
MTPDPEGKRNANVEGRYDPGNAQTWAHNRRQAHRRRAGGLAT